MRNTNSVFKLFLLVGFFTGCQPDHKPVQISEKRHFHISQPEYLPSDSIQRFLNFTNDFQQSAFLYSNIGNYNSALSSFDRSLDTVIQEVYWDSINNLPISAIEEIVRQSANCRLIIINEAHHVAKHRLFTLLLLEKLKKKGFNYFGAETLSKTDTFLMKRGYPVKNSGYFITEPQYGNLIRTAITTGYTVFPYEADKINDPSQREIEQAKNILSILNDSHAKVVVHCGYSHLLEDRNIPGWGMAMAGRIKEMSGIDPLTIDQVELTEHSSLIYENPFYRKLDHDNYCIWKNNGKTMPICFRLDKTQSDLFVYHPRTTFKFGRPDWLFQYYKPVFLKNDLSQLNYPLVIKAYVDGEDIEFAIPVDVIEIKNKTDKIALALLGSRKYQIVVVDRLRKNLKFSLST